MVTIYTVDVLVVFMNLIIIASLLLLIQMEKKVALRRDNFIFDRQNDICVEDWARLLNVSTVDAWI